MFTITLQSRDFKPIIKPKGRFNPLHCSWCDPGGPEFATIAVESDPRALAGLSGLLGIAVMVHDPNGCPFWWGYIHGIELQDDSLSHQINLNNLANSIAVLHTLPDGVTTNLSAWADDSGSQSIYGSRERILTLEAASVESANAWRDVELRRHAHPKWSTANSNNEEAKCILTCRGWYETLGWMYYACAEGTPVDTTEQMAAMVAACGQFLNGIRVESQSGISTAPWREGLTTARSELEMLAELGNSEGRDLRLRTDSDRVLVVEKAPLPGGSDWSLGEDGFYRDRYGIRQPGWASPAGRWVRPAGWAHMPLQPLGGCKGAGYVARWEYRFSD